MIRFTKSLYKFCSKNSSKLIDPYTHQVISTKPYIQDSEIFSKITEATKANREWKQISLQQRIRLTRKFIESIIDDKNMIRQTIASQIGKSYRDINEQFKTIQDLAQNFIQSSNQALKSQQLKNDMSKIEKISFQSVGLSLIFPYYSEPILDSVIHLIPCLISGGGALVKSSEYSHSLGGYLEQKAQKILGFKALISDIFIHPSKLPDLAQFRSIKKVIYSGSQSSARHIFETMVKQRFIDCNLFFGGQDAAYVDSTADIKKAAKQISKFAFYNNGQSYDCIKRLYLHHSIQQQFLEALVQETVKLNFGNPKDPSTDLGPLCIQEASLQVESMITDSINDDAICITGGMITTDGQSSGIFCEPTIFRNCSSDMPIVQSQLPAPILATLEVQSDQQFVQLVNANNYGTGIRIFTRDHKRYQRIVDELEVGRIVFNSASMLLRNLPIQGWKRSGKGKILSRYSYEEYTLPKIFNIKKLNK